MDTQETVSATPLPRTEEEAERLANVLHERGVSAALIGGVAVYLRCSCAASSALRREYKDIDFVTVRSMVSKLTPVLEEHGHLPDKRFNALHGSQRLFFWDEHNGRQLDVFVDRFEIHHSS